MVDPNPSGSGYSHHNGCSMLLIPTSLQLLDRHGHLYSSDPFEFITDNIAVEIELSPDCSTCIYAHGGQCRLDNTQKFYCYKGNKSTLLIAAIASAGGALGAMIFLIWCIRRRFYKKKNPTHQIIEMFLNTHGHLAAKRYSYSEIKKATNSFRYKLGHGGYGSVYKGKLQDGSLVAVKVLSDSIGNGEEFIDEVASISVTSHVNIVSLLGFCLEGSKRALIYKYMPNGSLEKFIYEDKDPLKLNLQLSCKTIYNIAIGVARGLEYLHRGCNTKILHFDIKPHNILLDEDFCPKISDFGLAKICPKKESIVSLLGTRGTAGYIAPEVFSRNFGEVSHKSDVYSYGMMVLEMVGERVNNNVEVECSSEIYFPHWVYKRLELNQEPRLRSIKNESDKEMVRKLVIVSLWCIQTDPSNRPAMSRVVDMMEGSMESLQIPPKPYLSSPPRSPPRPSDHNTYTSHTTYPSEN
ncbi:LEAF RUST 10 DISEASE-RESISTANCE LOCUS RECEPTOR-LIKE PROTEIN KINASE-like 2.1 isoform A [Glycine soja]|nr:LEAF RUST 10 DISEASE-RESISTANCE LOCUS RECEPTOR-LIKE PROTEIN KINASE-like 2.1 isoform A [Glycine soja]